MTWVAKVANIDKPNEDTDDGDDLGEQMSEIVDLLLERRLLADLCRDRLMDVADGGARTSGGHDSLRFAVDDGSALRGRTCQHPSSRLFVALLTENSMLTMSCLTACSSLTTAVDLLTD